MPPGPVLRFGGLFAGADVAVDLGFAVLFVAGFFSAIARHPFRMSDRILDAESDRGKGNTSSLPIPM